MNAPRKPLANGADRPVPGRQYGGNMGAVQAEDGAAWVTLPPLATIMLEYEG